MYDPDVGCRLRRVELKHLVRFSGRQSAVFCRDLRVFLMTGIAQCGAINQRTIHRPPNMKIAGVPEPFNLPLQLAIEDGAFPGMRVDYVDFPGGTGAMTAALSSGEIDAAILLTEGALFDIATGGGNRLVKVFVESPLVWGIHVAAGSRLTDIDDIEGKRVAISRYGSGSHLIAIVDAMQRGFDTDSMSFVVVDNIAAGEADIFLWATHMAQPLVDAGEFRRIGERVVPWPAFSISVRHEVAQQQGAELRRVFDAAWEYSQRLREMDDGASLISTRYGITPEDASRWLTTVEWYEGFDRPDEVLHRTLSALRAQGSIDATDLELADLWLAI